MSKMTRKLGYEKEDRAEKVDCPDFVIWNDKNKDHCKHEETCRNAPNLIKCDGEFWKCLECGKMYDYGNSARECCEAG